MVIHLKNSKDGGIIICPDGRHIDPEIAAKLGRKYCKTVKKGAFYIAAKSGKKVLPIWIEPNKIFGKIRVLYGNPIDPKTLNIYDEHGEVLRKKLNIFIEEWQKEISLLYFEASLVEDRKIREYKIHKVYR